MIYLDTHVVVWLYAGLVDRFGQDVRNLINENDVYISPIVRLELQYLSEVQRVMVDAGVVVTDLSKRLGLRVCDKGFDPIVNQAMTLSWTRDPFDRLIVANAALDDNLLVSKDQNILAHYPRATW